MTKPSEGVPTHPFDYDKLRGALDSFKPKSALERLVEAATSAQPDCSCPGPFTYTAHQASCPWQRWLNDTPPLREKLKALAPALAHELIEKRREGQALYEALKRIEKAAYEAVESADSNVIDELHEARKNAGTALDRWAKLTETEVRDG